MTTSPPTKHTAWLLPRKTDRVYPREWKPRGKNRLPDGWVCLRLDNGLSIIRKVTKMRERDMNQTLYYRLVGINPDVEEPTSLHFVILPGERRCRIGLYFSLPDKQNTAAFIQLMGPFPSIAAAFLAFRMRWPEQAL